jgi:hypothetical protein
MVSILLSKQYFFSILNKMTHHCNKVLRDFSIANNEADYCRMNKEQLLGLK